MILDGKSSFLPARQTLPLRRANPLDALAKKKSSFLGECAGEFLEVGEVYPRAVPGREHGKNP